MLPQAPIPQDLYKPIAAIVEKAEPKEPKQYILKQNETLTYVSELYTVDLSRLWAKNVQLTNPDLIAVGTPILIPEAEEKLEPRDMISASVSRVTGQGSSLRGASFNGYSKGYCTAYAWSRRQDLPGNLGDAHSWAANAARQGFTVSDTPKAGAIGVTRAYSHVVYIESVNPDGTVSLSEQNYKGLGVVSTRVAPASEFRYIY